MWQENSVWQSNFGYWQNGFIHANLLVIGYYSWKGFLKIGRGVVVCDVDAKAADPRTTSLDLIPFTTQFIPKQQVLTYIQKYGFEGGKLSVFLQVVNTYDPHKELVILLTINGHMEVNLLQNLVITPPECYQQVYNRWEEFQPSLMS
ncbi:hypothetical protein [Brasilonema sp. UFV-L1]|uniref:hypothetical protein n=1 Tax=Brasilonema sp. UFV-L1 TaxID=2234130 RepID=UPI00145CB63F|nr:hypothetical protein [Brasilonema sp. UFV-L1]NMG10461.1 hypothetical protein [Brasilonema sp. UFV-L1]